MQTMCIRLQLREESVKRINGDEVEITVPAFSLSSDFMRIPAEDRIRLGSATCDRLTMAVGLALASAALETLIV